MNIFKFIAYGQTEYTLVGLFLEFDLKIRGWMVIWNMSIGFVFKGILISDKKGVAILIILI